MSTRSLSICDQCGQEFTSTSKTISIEVTYIEPSCGDPTVKSVAVIDLCCACATAPLQAGANNRLPNTNMTWLKKYAKLALTNDS